MTTHLVIINVLPLAVYLVNFVENTKKVLIFVSCMKRLSQPMVVALIFPHFLIVKPLWPQKSRFHYKKTEPQIQRKILIETVLRTFNGVHVLEISNWRKFFANRFSSEKYY